MSNTTPIRYGTLSYKNGLVEVSSWHVDHEYYYAFDECTGELIKTSRSFDIVSDAAYKYFSSKIKGV